MDMMRMDPNGKNLVCRTCLERKTTQNQANPKQEESPFKEYFCKACKYNFKRAKHIAVGNCPYCGASGSIMHKGSTAKIISDAAKMKGDF